MKSKEQKRMEAEIRQERYNAMTDKEKEKKLNQGRFEAIRERKRKGFKPLS